MIIFANISFVLQRSLCDEIKKKKKRKNVKKEENKQEKCIETRQGLEQAD